MRELEFLQSSSPDPDYEVVGIIEFHEGLGGVYLLVREIEEGEVRPFAVPSGQVAEYRLRGGGE